MHLGGLGVITNVTLDVQPTFMVRQDVYENMPTAQLTDHMETVLSAGYSVSLFTDWQKNRVSEIWLKRRVEAGSNQAAPANFYGYPGYP